MLEQSGNGANRMADVNRKAGKLSLTRFRPHNLSSALATEALAVENVIADGSDPFQLPVGRNVFCVEEQGLANG